MVQTSGMMLNRRGLLACSDAFDMNLLETISDIRRLKVAAAQVLEGKSAYKGVSC